MTHVDPPSNVRSNCSVPATATVPKDAAASVPPVTFAAVKPGGNAKVTLVPDTVANVVPGGTLPAGLFTPMPCVSPVPLLTVAEDEPLVVVSDVATDPHTATLNQP